MCVSCLGRRKRDRSHLIGRDVGVWKVAETAHGLIPWLFEAHHRIAERTTPNRRLGETGGAGATPQSGHIEQIATAPTGLRNTSVSVRWKREEAGSAKDNFDELSDILEERHTETEEAHLGPPTSESIGRLLQLPLQHR